MALQDFIKKLEEQEDSDVIYSKQPEAAIKVIPPVKDSKKVIKFDTGTTKVIPPRTEPVVIKFVLKNNVQKEQSNKSDTKQQPKIQQQKQESEVEMIDRLFKESDTDIKLKDKWVDAYNKARASKKDSITIKMMKQGKFTLDNNGEIILSSTYKSHGKSSNQVLNDKWI